MKSWTPTLIRRRILEILKEEDTKMTPEEVHKRMPSCDKQKMISQLSYMASKETITKESIRGHSCSYQWNSSSDKNRWISQIWRHKIPLFTEPRVASRGMT
jgi:Fe2+ or Zn2+ uptake regulation protein